ncbi:MAG: polyhydroxybutyrate depolymerase [Pseudomonadota bacterium]
MMRILICFVGLFVTWTSLGFACEGQEACPLGDRSYHLRVPDNWDGQSALPVLLHFHGWARQGDLIVRHDRIATKIVADDVLLLAPNGLDKTWSFRVAGSPDTAFARAVLEDAAKRYPIDRDKIFVSGYSWGARMAWRFVCEDGDGIAALLAVAGTLPQDIHCPTQPAAVRQVFGLDDQVLPFPTGPDGDQTYPVALWREKFGCADGQDDGPWAARSFLTFQRTSWGCTGGDVVLDVHPGGHFIPHDWIPIQVAEILSAQ